MAEAFARDFGQNLTVSHVSAVSSHKSELVQLADVIAGTVNRRKNHKGDRGYKDDVADLVIDRFGIQLQENELPEIDATAWLSV